MFLGDLVEELGSLEKAVEYAIKNLGYRSEEEARFHIALDRGEITGDDIEEDDKEKIKSTIKEIINKYNGE